MLNTNSKLSISNNKKLSKKDIIMPIVIFILTIVIWTSLSHGLSLILTFDLAMVISIIMYFKFSYKTNNSYASAAPLYFVALAVQFLHFSEEYATGFNARWPVEIFASTPYDQTLFLLVNMISYFFFAIAGVAMLKNIKFPLIIAWFFVIMGVCIQAIQHTVYAIMVKGYFPGLYTSLICYILGPMLVVKFIKISRGSMDDKKN